MPGSKKFVEAAAKIIYKDLGGSNALSLLARLIDDTKIYQTKSVSTTLDRLYAAVRKEIRENK